MDGKLSAAPPPTVRVLEIGGEVDNWLQASIKAAAEPSIRAEQANLSDGTARLRSEHFDCVVLAHHPGRLDAMTTWNSLRAINPCQPIVVLYRCLADRSELSSEVDGFLDRERSSPKEVAWTIRRAVERQSRQTETENIRTKLEAQRRQLTHGSLFQLRAQKSLLMESQAEPHPADWLTSQLAALLKVYVVAGHGNPGHAVRELAETLRKSQVTLNEVLFAHTVATEALVLSLGQLPSGHIMTRANLLAYELVLHMQETACQSETPSVVAAV